MSRIIRSTVLPVLSALTVALSVLVAAPALANRNKVAVLPVVVHASGEQDNLESGVSDMLSSRLGQQPGVAVIRVNDPETATVDAAAAQAAGREVGADFVLFGSFTRFGDGASLDIKAASVEEDAQARSVFVQSGTISELIPKIDALAERIGVYIASGAPRLPAVAAAPLEEDGASEIDGVRAQIEILKERIGRLEAELNSLRAATAP